MIDRGKGQSSSTMRAYGKRDSNRKIKSNKVTRQRKNNNRRRRKAVVMFLHTHKKTNKLTLDMRFCSSQSNMCCHLSSTDFISNNQTYLIRHIFRKEEKNPSVQEDIIQLQKIRYVKMYH